MGLFKKKKKNEIKLQELPPFQEDTHRKKGGFKRLRREKPWLFRGVMVSLACAIFFSSFYGVFYSRAEAYQDSPIESADNIAWLFQSCYLLYRDLYNVKEEKNAGYTDLYLEMKEGYEWLLDEKKLSEYREFLYLLTETAEGEEYSSGEKMGESIVEEALAGELQEGLREYIENGILDEDWLDWLVSAGEGSRLYDISQSECDALQSELSALNEFFLSLETGFRELNVSYDYLIEDSISGKCVTNMSEEDRNREAHQQYFQISFLFDSAGNVSIGDSICGRDVSQLRKAANEAVRENLQMTQPGNNLETLYKFGSFRMPTDCTVTFSVSKAAWESRKDNFYLTVIQGVDEYGFYTYSSRYSGGHVVDAYLDSGLGGILAMCMLLLALLGAFLPILKGTKPWKEERACAVSFEFLLCFCVMLFVSMEYVLSMIAYIASGEAGGALSDYLGDADFADFLIVTCNLTVMTLLFFGCF